MSVLSGNRDGVEARKPLNAAAQGEVIERGRRHILGATQERDTKVAGGIGGLYDGEVRAGGSLEGV